MMWTHEAWEQPGKPHEESTLWYRQSLWKWFLFFVFNQCFYACNENNPAGRHNIYWTELNCSQRSLATRHRQAVNKKAICQSVSAHSSNQWRLSETGNATVGGHNMEGTTRRRPHREDPQEDRWRRQGSADKIETSTRRSGNHTYNMSYVQKTKRWCHIASLFCPDLPPLFLFHLDAEWMTVISNMRAIDKWMEGAGRWESVEQTKREREKSQRRPCLIINKWKMLLVHLINRVVREKERLIGRWDEEWGDGGGRWGGVGEFMLFTLVAVSNFHPHWEQRSLLSLISADRHLAPSWP